MYYRITDKCVDLIKRFEGCKLTAYKCPAGIPTIGFGTTSGVKMGMMITEAQALDFLRRDLMKFEATVNHAVTVALTPNMLDALVCFCYNIGESAFKQSTLLKKLNAGDYTGAANEFLRWNKSNGKVLVGLIRRREAERALFLEESFPG